MSVPIPNMGNHVGMSGSPMSAGSVSPQQPVPPKNVAFELMFPESPQYRARLPMRVQIYPHDDTESIVTTVKNFYGLYSGPTGSKGVSFEDERGNTLIARYENFSNHMVVYVRVFEESPIPPSTFRGQASQSPASDGHVDQKGGQNIPAPQYTNHFSQNTSRHGSRSPQKRSPSPESARGRRSPSLTGSAKKSRSRSVKHRASMDGDDYSESMNGYSSDGAPSSTSGKNKDHLGNTDISVENIVEGGRRKRAKFESSELPLFAPPQMPAATSNPSVSPARRIEQHRPSLPFVPTGQNPFTNPRSFHSTHHSSGFAQSGMYASPGQDGHRSRNSISYSAGAAAVNGNAGILPTPDPTVGSCMSEEDKDVAIQLMRLGDMSNISHGRTSASTLDDTFSGRADAASSTGATSDSESESEDEEPAARRQKLDSTGAARPVYQTTNAHFQPATVSAEASGDEGDRGSGITNMSSKTKTTSKSKSSSSSASKLSAPKLSKAARPAANGKQKKLPSVHAGSGSPMPMGPPRKESVSSASNVPLLPGEDDQPDLSTKPRCQRCRKSKKGCDRQRPCGRCRDAGLSADQCISEDEGNGRKGRFGRHMGVPILKDEPVAPTQTSLLPAAPILTASAALSDKAKKRKR